MSIIRKSFIGIFLLFFSTGFAQEIFQGNLKNGMRYYVCPNMEQEEITISFVIKASPQLFMAEADISILNSFDCIFDDTQEERDNPEYSILSAQITQRHFWKKLSQLSEHFTNNFYLDEVIEEIREKSEESKRLKESYNFGEFLTRLYGIDFEYTDKVFSQGNEEIIKVCSAYFEPSRMALIISGPVKPLEIISKLQGLFGEKVGDGLFLDSVKFKVEKPIALKIRAYSAADEWLEDEEEIFQESNVYYYPLNPSFKDAVLNDLFVIANFGTECPVSFSPGTISEGSFFSFVNEIALHEVDEYLFSNVKAALGRFYQNRDLSMIDQCVQHFLSGFPMSIEDFNLGFLSELENITLKDLHSFIDEHIKNIPITGEYEIRM